VVAGWQSRLHGQRDVLHGRHLWCWSPCAPAQILVLPTVICFGFTSPLCEVLLLGIPWLVAAIRVKPLPDTVSAGDVDALERRFPPWSRHCESNPSTIGSR
jgi:hypothetical protein